MRWDACRGWQAFPRASDACDRDGSLLLLKSIAHPKGTRQVESVSADGVGRYAPPQRPAAQCSLRISAPSHGRPVKPHHIQLCSSCFSRPAPLVLRLFSVAPKGPRACLPPPRREDCLHAGKNRGAPENAKRRDTFLPFTERRGSAGRSRTRIWRAKAPTAICGFESSSGNPRTRNASAPETPSSTTSKATPRCLASKRSSPPRRLHWEPLRSQASPTGLGFAPGPRQRCRDSTTTRAQVWRRLLSYVRAPARGSTPPSLYSAALRLRQPADTPLLPPGLKTNTAFRPSPPANALRLRRPVAVLRRRQSAAQLYAVVDLYTAIWFVTRMRRLTGADSAQHDLLTILRTWISASVSSEQWGHVSQWRRRRAAASRGI